MQQTTNTEAETVHFAEQYLLSKGITLYSAFTAYLLPRRSQPVHQVVQTPSGRFLPHLHRQLVSRQEEVVMAVVLGHVRSGLPAVGPHVEDPGADPAPVQVEGEPVGHVALA